MTMRLPLFALLSLVLTSGAHAQEAPQILTITLSSYAFTPSAIALKAGTPVRLHLVNSAGKSHSFMAREFFAASTVAAEDQAKLRNGEIELNDGESLDVTVTPAQPGAYPLKCTHFMHSALGMTGTITVQ